ncbi:formimidoylglutamate deiminase [Cryobacterium algoricola]|uniref:Formimidoylglutamate deiminase n=1 Tax=Cryobacterium algoricola TaxID=1259183 RepID=A0ABY2IDA9_9MICO|nr:formimidoylglutamate deiminase [Cryobacterium algoricola]TFB85292.1 formimidoylglutamate deiminase [Cryobacterium algoricola]
MTYWCATALIDGQSVNAVRVHAAPDGTIAWLETGVPACDDDVLLGTVFPGMGDAHSHAFHRALRGRTQADGGDFWRWRESMYAAASALDPDLYYELASAVFAEMLVSGWTAVGEFHYVHHRPDGRPYPDAHAMELAVAAAARDTGIRLTLLDTCYLRGGANRPLSDLQLRFGDGSADAWLRRWDGLRDSLDAGSHAVAGSGPAVTLGAALHSVRALPRSAMATILAGLPPTVPLHIHLSEQPQENAECLAEYGLTPTGLLHELGALTPRLSVVHATHLTDADVKLLGDAGVTAVFCPTTEADLGDGIGPARRLADAGARLALGSDQNAVVDPFLEARGLEAGERLASGRRGRFSPPDLTEALTRGGYASLGLGTGGLQVGAWLDLVELDAASVRTVGASANQLPLVATASDVRRVIVGGRIVASDGLTPAGDPALLLGAALRRLDETIADITPKEPA